MGRKRREGVYARKRDQTFDHADAVSGTKPEAIEVVSDEVVASIASEIVNHGRPVELTSEEIEQREVDRSLRDMANHEREARQREGREREAAQRAADEKAEADRKAAEGREAALRETRERWKEQQAKREAQAERDRVGSLEQRWNMAAAAARQAEQEQQRQATAQNIDQIFTEMHAIINPPRDLNAERIAALEEQAAEAEQARLDAADPMRAVLRNIGRSWWG